MVMVRTRLAQWIVSGSAAVAALLVMAVPATAQRGVAPKRLMVTTLRGADPAIRNEATDRLRDAIEGEFPPRIAQVISKRDIEATLEASGYIPNEPLSPNDAKALASQVRADEYFDGQISKTATGFRMTGKWLLGRDNGVYEPLAPIEGADVRTVAREMARQVRTARDQVDDEGRCYLESRQSRYDDALRIADRGIQRFKQHNMLLVCKLATLQSMRKPEAELLPVAEAILAADSLNRLALTAASAAYKAAEDSTNYIKSLLRLVSIDPGNVRLVTQVVNDLGAYRRAEMAMPIIKPLVEENPGDPVLLNTAWKVALASGNWKDAITWGEELATADTSAADATFFERLAAAYASDSQPMKVAEALARGTAKFPENAGLWLALGAQQRKNGQPQQAIESIRRALAVDPKAENAHVLIAQAFVEMQQPDSAIAEVRLGLAAGTDKALLGQYTTSIANGAYRTANETKARDDFAKALSYAQLADSLEAQPAAKFLAGASAVQVAISALQDASKEKSCELATKATDHFAIAEINVPAGGQFNAQAAGQLMGVVQQYGPVSQQLQKALCKSGRR
jgi:tetratricopeptide (TPR) repeat protein